MYNRNLSRKHFYGSAGAALVASLSLVGGSMIAATSASADTTTTTTSTTVAPTTTTTVAPTTTTTVAPTTTSTLPSVPVTTMPQGPDSLKKIQNRSNYAVNIRVSTLNHDIKVAERETYLGGDQATLVSHMQADITGLEALKASIDADTSPTVAQTQYREIFSDYRVFYFVVPDTSLVTRTDYIDNVSLPATNKQITTEQGELTSANVSSTANASKLVSDAQTLAGNAAAATDGLSATLLGYTAQDWDVNHKLLASAQGAVSSAQWDVVKANADLAQAQRDLDKGANRHSHTA